MTPIEVPLAVNGKWLVRPLTGTGRYSTEAIKALLAAGHRPRIVVPADAVVPDWLSGSSVVRSKYRGQLFEQVVLPWSTRDCTLLNLSGPAPLLARRQVVVMHDATPFRFPDAFSKRFALWYRVMYRWLARGRARLVTVSGFSADELAECLRVRRDRFIVARPAASVADIQARHPDAALPDRFFLVVGTLARNKNLLPAVRVLVDEGYSVVVVGAKGASRVFRAGDDGLRDDAVTVLGRIPDEELAWLYRNAVALVFPSLYEGFGLPILEAQAQGCPVVSSDRAAMPEVCTGSALFFDPARAETLADAARVVWTDDLRRQELVDAGRRNVDRFAWGTTADAILEASRA